MKRFLLPLFLLLIFFGCKNSEFKENAHQRDSIEENSVAWHEMDTNRYYLGEEIAREQLHEALNNSGHNVIDDKKIIKDSATAIKVVEPIIFNIYGKDNIIKQRPYEVHFLDNFWVINGTLPKPKGNIITVGGTFLIIMDSRNGVILKISHGK
jgi:hypothetical protein